MGHEEFWKKEEIEGWIYIERWWEGVKKVRIFTKREKCKNKK